MNPEQHFSNFFQNVQNGRQGTDIPVPGRSALPRTPPGCPGSGSATGNGHVRVHHAGQENPSATGDGGGSKPSGQRKTAERLGTVGHFCYGSTYRLLRRPWVNIADGVVSLTGGAS